MAVCSSHHQVGPLPETNSLFTPGNQWLVQMIHFLLGQFGPVFRGKLALSFRENKGRMAKAKKSMNYSKSPN